MSAYIIVYAFIKLIYPALSRVSLAQRAELHGHELRNERLYNGIVYGKRPFLDD